MRLVSAFLIVLFLIGSIGLVEADNQIVLSPQEGHSNQNQITEALKNGDVYLSAGIYEVDGPIEIGSNRVLTGDSDAIIRVWSGSSQWFVGNVGIIVPNDYNNVIHDVEIYGFQIDGNCDELPASYANYGNGDHNAERLIFLRGYSNLEKGFIYNISIHDMELYDAFCDGIHISFGKNIHCYNNLISNCQHEGIFWVSVIGGIAEYNKIAGITSDCFRTDNGVDNIIRYNYFYSYTGDHNNGANEGGHQGIQIADQGYSHGGGVTPGHDKPTKTTNIEVYGNSFSGDKRMNVWLDSTQKGVDNVYIHDNKFHDGEAIETKGIPVDESNIGVDGIITVSDNGLNIEDISESNPPTIEMSKKIFSSIFDVLEMDFSDTGYLDQGTLNPEKKWHSKGKYTKAWIDVPGYKGEIHIGNRTYIPDAPEKCAIVLYGTENLAPKPVNQTATKKLSVYGDNLTVELKVKTSYKVKTGRKKLGIIPEYRKKSETVKFSRTFEAPEIFPAFNPPKVYVTYYNGSHAIVSVPKIDGIVRVDSDYNNSTCRERRLVGYVGTAANNFKSTDYTEVNSWTFTGTQLSQNPKGLYVKDHDFDLDKLNVTIVTPYDSFEGQIEYRVIEDDSGKIVNGSLLVFLILIGIYGRAILQVVYGLIGRWIR